MSSLSYFNLTGFGTNLSIDYHYSQAVRLPGSIVKLSGQGGWDAVTGDIIPPASAEAISDQVARAFVNVDDVLRVAGLKNGWDHVYQVKAYLVQFEDYDGVVAKATTEELKKWCPEHRPLLTLLPVEKLVLEGMRIEVEVEAFDDELGAGF